MAARAPADRRALAAKPIRPTAAPLRHPQAQLLFANNKLQGPAAIRACLAGYNAWAASDCRAGVGACCEPLTRLGAPCLNTVLDVAASQSKRDMLQT